MAKVASITIFEARAAVLGLDRRQAVEVGHPQVRSWSATPPSSTRVLPGTIACRQRLVVAGLDQSRLDPELAQEPGHELRAVRR